MSGTSKYTGKTLRQDPPHGFSSFSVIMVFALLSILGVALIPRLFISLSPSHSLPAITVSYHWYRASPEIIEKKVTAPLEGLFSTMQQLRSISSHTKRSSGSIELSFDEDANMDIARFQVASLIRQVHPDLPRAVSYPEVTLNMPNEERRSLLTYTLYGSASGHLLQKYAENNLKPLLANIKGVYQVSVYGATPFAWYVTYNSGHMEALQLTPADIEQALRNHFRGKELGYTHMGTNAFGNDYYRFRLEPGLNSTESWQHIPIGRRGNRIVYLTDVATIRYKQQPSSSYFRVNGLNTINLVIDVEKQVNSLKLANEIKTAIGAMKRDLPKNYSLEKMYDATTFIKKELNKVALRTVIALVVLLLFVLITIRRMRFVAMIMLSLLINLCIAVIFYVVLGVEIHLYSLAGMTISLGIIIDNSIIMADHIRHRGNRRAFLSLLAATLTTIGALSLVFFLSEKDQLNLLDFSLIIMINLGVSLFVSLFFIPAMLDLWPLDNKKKLRAPKKLRRIARLSRGYEGIIRFQLRYKWAFVVILVLLFGLPVHKLPEAFDEPENNWEELYNNTLGSDKYQRTIKPVVDKLFGGTLRLFTEFVYESHYYSSPEQTKLYISGKMPDGSTIHQMNEACQKMEAYLARFPEIALYTTSIRSYRNGRITVYFTPEAEGSFFPFYLKNLLIGKANSLGGMDWGIYGVGRGFSNSTGSDHRNDRIMLYGYNYDQLYGYAQEVMKKLGENPRVQKMQIRAKAGWFLPPLRNELCVELNEEMLAQLQFNSGDLFTALQRKSLQEQYIGSFFVDDQLDEVRLASNRPLFDRWNLENEFLPAGTKKLKIKGLGRIVKRAIGNDIVKKNQQYQLTVEYNFVGPSKLASRIRKIAIDEMNQQLPLGYKADADGYYWRSEEKRKAGLLVLVICIIFFICAILFESLKQPFVILSIIPLSFVGAFLTFYLFDISFDQGGYAAFVLLAGLTVNAALYIINEYNNLKPIHGTGLQTYLRAFHHKIVPIFLTLSSTILGLVPFLLGGSSEPFWYSFAAGSIGGLVMSFVGLLLFLPVYFLRRK
ncbi:MAG: efflux RND transporter permease subunit [Bacteroidales bacterium]